MKSSLLHSLLQTLRKVFPAASLLGIALLLVGALPGMAQSITADILGTVSDPTGAALPNATVTIVNLGTQETRTATAGATGEYTFTLLQPGNYQVRAESPGFKAYQVNSLTLGAGDRSRVNAQLALGASSESIQVNADEIPTLQTDNATVQNVVPERAVQDLPLNGRNFVGLIQITAGVNQGLPTSIASGTRPDDRRPSASFSANGQPDTLNNNLIDGLDNNEREQGFIGIRPSIDSIGEIRVLTNDYSAEVGRSTGAVVNVVTKSGTNNFHGTLFEFIRNDLFDARDAFALSTAAKPKLRQNNFGGSIGGPIFKNKTFFFSAVEFDRRIAGSTSTVTVPTAQERNNLDFTDRPGGAVLSSSQVNPVSLRYFQLFPLPNRPGLVNNFTASPSTTQYGTTLDVRVDHHFNDQNLLFGEFDYNPITTTVPGVLPTVSPSWAGGAAVSPGGALFSFAGPSQGTSKGVRLDYIHTFTPNLLMELRAGYTGIGITTLPLNYGENLSTKIGVVNGNLGDAFSSALSPIYFLDGSATVGDGAFVPIIDHNNTFQYNGILTYTRGAHSIRAGGALIRRQLNYYQSQFSPQGEFWVPSFQTFLQGITAFAVRGNLSNLQGFRTWEPSGFVQDDWRVNKSLTLNLGARYEVFTPFKEAHNIFSNFDLATLRIKLATNDDPTAGVATDYKDISPRFGFALQMPHQSVIRGGYGMSYYPQDIQSQIQNPNPPYNFVCFPCFGYSYPALPLSPSPSSVNLANPSGNLTYKPANFRSGYYHQFNLFVEKEVMGNTVSVGYVASLGHRLLFQQNINRPAPGTTPLAAGSAAPARVYAAQLPNVGTITANTNLGVNSYHSLQATFARRYRAGLTFNFNYTYAHGLGDAVNPSQNNDNGLWTGNPAYDYSNSAVDLRHRVAFSANYELPLGKNLNGASAFVAKGWQVNTIAYWQTGLPFGVANGVAPQINLPDVTSDRPNRYASYSDVPANVFAGGKVQCLGANNTGHCFAPQPFGTPGNARQFSEYGPHQRSVNLSLFKNFPVYREATVQFRAEAFNLTNTPNFTAPSGAFETAAFGTTTATASNQNPRQLQFALKLAF